MRDWGCVLARGDSAVSDTVSWSNTGEGEEAEEVWNLDRRIFAARRALMPISDIYSSQMGGQLPRGQKEPPEIVAPNPSWLARWQGGNLESKMSDLLWRGAGCGGGVNKRRSPDSRCGFQPCGKRTLDNNALATELSPLPGTTFQPVIFSARRQNMKQRHTIRTISCSCECHWQARLFVKWTRQI